MVTETIFIAKFNVTDTTNPTSLFNNPNLLKEIEIDGVKQPSVVTSYQFNTTGEHIVKYTLTEVKNNLTSDCFAGKINMVSITLPNTITSIGGSAFGGCTSLTNITMPNGVTSIGDSAFGGCTSLTNITMPNGVTSIGYIAFGGCKSLTSITIPSSVTNIGWGAFNDCSGLTSITIPSSVTSIGGSLGDFNYEDIIFETINPNATFVCDNTNKVLVSVDNSTLICGFNNTIAIPNSVTNIGDYAFYRCRSLTSVTIPNSVISIGVGAFNGCTSLTSITIPSSVTSIDRIAFAECSGLRSITSLAITAPTIHSNTFSGVKTNGTLYVPSGSDYSTWMQYGLYYLKYYNWIKVEQ